MRNSLLRRFLTTPPSRFNSSLPSLLSSRRNAASSTSRKDEAEKVDSPREGPEISYGLNSALAGKGIIVEDKAFINMKSYELQQRGATITENLSGLPVRVRGKALDGGSEITKAQFVKLIKQVTSHLSSISDIFVHDGSLGSSPKCDAKVRVITDDPSAVLSVSNLLWSTPARSVSHDTCPLTLYIATSISQSAGEAIGLGAEGNTGFIAADVERSSAIVCGKAFADTNAIKEVLSTLCGPIIFARGGVLLSARLKKLCFLCCITECKGAKGSLFLIIDMETTNFRLLVSGDTSTVLFASDDTIQSCSDMLVSGYAGVILSSNGVAPLFQTRKSGAPNLYKLPAAVVLAISDSSGAVPPISKLSPSQAAYHFLTGYQNGTFVPAYNKGPSSVNPVELAKALHLKLQDDGISSYLINVSEGKKQVTGKDLVKLVQSALTEEIPPFKPKGENLKGKYKAFLSGKFKEIPKEFSF